jgi:hypothetical protein
VRLLIDGDISRYELGAVCQSVEMHFGTTVMRPHSEQKVREVVDRFVNGIVERTDCDGFELFLSGGTNYRNEIAVTHPYKGQRFAPKPYHWKTVGDILQEDYGAYIVHGAEADDALSVFARMDPDNTIIASRDKDLRIVPCLHYSWRCGESQPEIPVHRVDELGWISAKAYKSGGYKLVGEGLKFFYGQVLAGDAIDNYKGCPGCGPQKAALALANCSSELELFEAARGVYSAKLGPEKGLQLLIENARLAWLLDDAEVTYDANNIFISPKCLWEPPTSIPTGQSERPVPESTVSESPVDDPSGQDWTPPWCN